MKTMRMLVAVMGLIGLASGCNNSFSDLITFGDSQKSKDDHSEHTTNVYTNGADKADAKEE